MGVNTRIGIFNPAETHSPWDACLSKSVDMAHITIRKRHKRELKIIALHCGGGIATKGHVTL